MAHTSDAELIGAMADRHLGAIYSYLARRVGSGLAGDLAAETFAEAVAHAGRFDRSRGEELPWLFGIASNVLKRHRRAEVKWLRVRAHARDERVGFGSTEAVERLDAGALRGELAEALASLSRRNREVLLLFAWADLGYDEIAVALGIPVGTVRSRLNRARASLRKQLSAVIEEEIDEKAVVSEGASG